MRIALVKCPPTYSKWTKRPVLGLTQLAAYLKLFGHEVRVLDGYYHNWNSERLISNIIEYKPELVGITAMTNEIDAASAIATEIKKLRHVPIVVGGIHVTVLPKRTMEEYPVFDYGIVGEGEFTLRELVDRLVNINSRSLNDVLGLVFRDKDTVIENNPRPFLTEEEINSLPFPDFTDYYGCDKTALTVGNVSYPLCTSRGCPYHCVFCTQVFGHTLRRKSSEKVIKEIEYAVENYGARLIDFVDELFLEDRLQTRQVMNHLIDSGLSKKIKWTGQTRANCVKPELIALAKKSGCVYLSLGVESGDDEILKRIDKRITVEQVKNAVAIIKQADIELTTLYILGHPGETYATAKKTVDLAIRLNTTMIAFGMMVPYPGTNIYTWAKNNKMGYRLLSEKWSNYDKYENQTMSCENVTWSQLENLRRKAFLMLFVRNFRFVGLIQLFWVRRSAVIYFLLGRVRRSFNFAWKPVS